MGERSLRGSRLGSVSYETERNTAPAELPGAGAGCSPAVRYQVLCRRHYVRGELGPTPAGPGQLALP